MPRTTRTAGRTRRAPAALGTVEKLPSGRFRAFYRHQGDKFTAPRTFETAEAARGWLAAERAERAQGTWRDPRLGLVTLADYARGWLDSRADLAPRTRALYASLLTRRILSPVGTAEAGRLDLGPIALATLTPTLLRTWFARLSADCARDAAAPRRATWTPASTHGGHPVRAWAIANGYQVADRGRLPAAVLAAYDAAGRPPAEAEADPRRSGRTTAAQTYRLLHAILATAVSEGLLTTNPAQVKGAGTVRHAERETATAEEVARLAELMPDKLAAAVWLAAWSGLRRGELLGLARRHLDLDAGSVRVERALGQDLNFHQPKTRASVRTVYLPPTVTQRLADHLATHVGAEPDALLFTNANGGPLNVQHLQRRYDRARRTIARPSLTWHDLRHTGATLAYRAGGSVRDVQARLGHATARAAMIYAHTADDAGRHLAAKLDQLVNTEAPPTSTPPDRPATPAPSPAPAEPAADSDAASPQPNRTRRRHLHLVPDLTTERNAS